MQQDRTDSLVSLLKALNSLQTAYLNAMMEALKISRIETRDFLIKHAEKQYEHQKYELHLATKRIDKLCKITENDEDMLQEEVLKLLAQAGTMLRDDTNKILKEGGYDDTRK